MSEPKETGGPSTPGQRKPLSLKRTVEAGHVQQKFSHGRSKPVEVVKKKSRTVTVGDQPAAPAPAAAPAAAAPPAAAPATASAQAARVEVQRTAAGRTLSDSELQARAKALAAAQERTVEEQRAREEYEAAERARAAAEDRDLSLAHGALQISLPRSIEKLNRVQNP